MYSFFEGFSPVVKITFHPAIIIVITDTFPRPECSAKLPEESIRDWGEDRGSGFRAIHTHTMASTIPASLLSLLHI